MGTPRSTCNDNDSGSCIAGNISQHVTIGRLPDEVLLKIFSLDRLISTSLSQDLPWEWYRLVHVCRRWRYIIFDSPQSLDLQLFCVNGTPVKDNLDVWPSLPIVMRYFAFSSPNPLLVSAREDDNIMAALQHPDRIRTIQLNVTTSLLERLATLVPEPFPALETLELATQTETGLVLPSESFGGPFPRLRVLHLTRITFPALQRLLLSAENLVSLKLEALPSSEYVSPEALMICLATVTLLETLHLRFNFPISRFIAGGDMSAPQSRVVLASLDEFAFHGASEYLECLLSGIDAPVLKNIDISFFNQATIFLTPQLLQFIYRTETQRWHDEAKVYRSENDISITLTRQGAPHRIGLRVRCMPLDWQLSCMAEICDNLSSIIADVRDLHIDASSPLPGGPDNMDPLPMSELFRRFSQVKRVFLTEKVARQVNYVLVATRVLPGAEVIMPGPPARAPLSRARLPRAPLPGEPLPGELLPLFPLPGEPLPDELPPPFSLPDEFCPRALALPPPAGVLLLRAPPPRAPPLHALPSRGPPPCSPARRGPLPRGPPPRTPAPRARPPRAPSKPSD